MKLSFILILILVVLGVHVLNKPLSRDYIVIGQTILGHSVRIDKQGDGAPYIVTQDGVYQTRYSRESYLNAFKLKPHAIRCWK